MTDKKLTDIINLKDEIEKLERTLRTDKFFYIGNPEQGTSDYYVVNDELFGQVKAVLCDRLAQLEKKFEQY